MKNKLYLVCCMLCCTVLGVPINANGQLINSIAGTTIAGFSGDGGPAMSAQVNKPMSTFTDDTGNVYIADAYNNRIRKINTAGVITTVAGSGLLGYFGDGGLATLAQLNHPDGVIMDSLGNMYICDADNLCIRKVNTSGIITTIAGNTISGFSGDGGPATAAEMTYPAAIALDKNGNLYIADEYNNRVRKVNSAGIISTFAGAGSGPYSGDGAAATATDIGFPFGLATDVAGNVYISLTYDNRICKVNTSGIMSTVAGTGTAGFSGDGGPATSATIDGPWGINTDWPGNLYIADANNNRIRKVNTSGIISTVAGNGSAGFSGDGGPATSAKINTPTGMCTDIGGAIYIADYLNNMIRKVSSPFTSVPSFTGGPSQGIMVCTNSTANPINTELSVADADAGQGERWMVVTPPMHGTVAAYYTMVSTGSTIVPSGLTYTPTSGYIGIDSFSVRITDGTGSDTTMIHVAIPDCTLGLLTANADERLSVYPNPNNGTFTLNLPGKINEEVQVSVTDMTGKCVLDEQVNYSKAMKIRINAEPGVYVLQVITSSATITKQLLITQ